MIGRRLFISGVGNRYYVRGRFVLVTYVGLGTQRLLSFHDHEAAARYATYHGREYAPFTSNRDRWTERGY